VIGTMLSARFGGTTRDSGKRDYSILAHNFDVESHFSSETGTSNTTVFTTPLRWNCAQIR